MRGWRVNKDSDNYVLRASCIINSSLDIIGIAETHLLGSDCIHVPGYTWF